MKLVVQRVSQAKVSVNGKIISKIRKGYFVLIGIAKNDTQNTAEVLAEKLYKLRIVENAEGKMSLSVSDIGGEMLIVSQFTLLANTTGTNRPDFFEAANADVAEPIYEHFVKKLISLGTKVKTGEFGADMKIDATLDGPVTILLEK